MQSVFFATLFTVTILIFCGPMAGCRANAHPDDQAAVYKMLDTHDLASVELLQDRGAGMITLRDIVGSAGRKARAEQLVRHAARGYTVVNHLRVEHSADAPPDGQPTTAGDGCNGATAAA